MSAPLSRGPAACPRACAYSPWRPASGPRSAARLLAMGARRDGTRKAGEGRQLGRGRWTPGPPPSTRIGSLPAAPPPLPLSASPGHWGVLEAGRQTTAAAETKCAGASSGLRFSCAASGRSEAAGSACALGFSEVEAVTEAMPFRDLTGAPHPKAPLNRPSSHTPNCLL